jgi:hypothetical protein
VYGQTVLPVRLQRRALDSGGLGFVAPETVGSNGRFRGRHAVLGLRPPRRTRLFARTARAYARIGWVCL